MGERATAPEAEDEVPAALGRYRVRRVLGSGTMGVVYEAFDPELERPRAIKLMRPRREQAKARARFLREAKAMASLEHRNVVAVHDVGEHEDQPFVVMDLVQGSTLHAWMVEQRPTWTEILDKFVQAGRGLAAAHDAGLVHRDFKPSNVLVAKDGSVKVTDFGLVRAASETIEPELQASAQEVARDGPAGEGDDLTRTGLILGTPAYMALEQFRGAPASPASDQFSFCVALFEALYGEHPFGGRDTDRLMESAERNDVRGLASGEVPGWMFDVLARGLRSEPERRWPSMHALLDALDPKRRSSSRSLAIAAVAAVVLAVGLGVYAKRDALRAWLSPFAQTLTIGQAEVEPPMRVAKDPAIGDFVFSPVANKGRVTFEVDLPTSGTYYLWALGWERTLGGDRGDADSFFVYVDEGEELLWHMGCQNEHGSTVALTDNWRWQRVGHMPNSDSDCVVEELGLELEAGRHRVVVRNREDARTDGEAARLARLAISNHADFSPR